MLFSLDNLHAMVAQRQRADLPPPPPPMSYREEQLGFQERALALAELESLAAPPPLLLPAMEPVRRTSWFVPLLLCGCMALLLALVAIAVVVNLRWNTVVVRTARSEVPAATKHMITPPVPTTARSADLPPRASSSRCRRRT